MRYTFLVLAVLLGVAAPAPAQHAWKTVTVVDKADKKATPSPTPEDYETALGYFEKYGPDKVFKLDTWKDVTLTHRSSKKEKKFSELSDLEQHVFVLIVAQRFSRESAALQGAWEKEAKKFDNSKHVIVLRDKIDNEKQKPAVKKEVQNYQKKLLDLRKKYAAAYEKFAENVADKYKEDLGSQEDRDKWRRQATARQGRQVGTPTCRGLPCGPAAH
jgi:hypothetical protein